MAEFATTYEKQQPEHGGRPRRAASYAGLNPENACKWRALNLLYAPGDAEWTKAANAPSWAHRDIVKRIRDALDAAWAIEMAKMSRDRAEREKEAARTAATLERNKTRRSDVREANAFIKQHKKKLSILHAPAEPKPVDPLAAKNPLSQDYEGRKKRKAPATESPQSSPDEELVVEAAEYGVAVLPRDSAKRRAVGGDDPVAVAAAEAALSKLSQPARVALLQKSTPPSTPTKTLVPKAPRTTPAAAKPRAAAPKPKKTAQEYYDAKLKDINAKRARDGNGPLSEASRVNRFCRINPNIYY